MKILAVSDSHGNIDGLRKLEKLMESSDYVFHLGDHDYDMKPFREKFDTKIYSVKGNCDGGGQEFAFSLNGTKIMLVHGDRYLVKLSLLSLRLRAKELGVNLVFYGHTHSADICVLDGITFINPGSISENQNGTYAVVEIENGKILAKIHNLYE